MIRGAIKGIWSLVVLGVALYAFFFVPLGDRTLFEHVWRIAHTDEAQDLGREAAAASLRAGQEVIRQVDDVDAHSDAGADELNAPAAP